MATPELEESRDVVVSLPKTVFGQVLCLFFGKRGCMLPLKAKDKGHPMVNAYNIEHFTCPLLVENVEEVAESNMPIGKWNVCACLRPTLTCSSVALSNTSCQIQATSTINIQRRPAVSNNQEVAVQTKQSTGKYAWAVSPDNPWEWPEYVWNEWLIKRPLFWLILEWNQPSSGTQKRTNVMLPQSSPTLGHCPWHPFRE